MLAGPASGEGRLRARRSPLRRAFGRDKKTYSDGDFEGKGQAGDVAEHDGPFGRSSQGFVAARAMSPGYSTTCPPRAALPSSVSWDGFGA